MNRRIQAALGVLCLLLAVVLMPPRPSSADGVLAAIGRSMGGSRVMVINALFLRAEAQRKAGRIEDAAALYRTVLDLDPANEAATIFLVNVYVDELIPQIPDEAERYAWWLQARELLVVALKRRPGSASLHARAAGIILDGRQSGLLQGRTPAERQQAMRLALMHLERAVELAATLPRMGRVHLVQVSLLAPEQAAEALRRRDDEMLQLALRVGDAALAKRGAVLEEMRLNDGGAVSLADILKAGLGAVRSVAAGRSPEALKAVAACRRLVPDWWRLLESLDQVLQR